MIADIRRVARLLNHSPSSVEYMRLGCFNIRTLQRKFRKSWSEIIASAGLRYTPRTAYRIPPTEELRADVIRVARELDHAPTRNEYQARGRFDAETVRRRSGEKKWEDALAAFAGLSCEEIKSHQSKGGCYRTTEEWLSKLRHLANELGHAPTTRESNEGGINAHQLCLRIGGNWTAALKAAGIDIKRRSLQARILSTPTEVMIEDVVAVSRRLGHPPKVHEYAKHGHYPYTALRGRLGGWRKVKQIVREKLWAGQSHATTMSLPGSLPSNSSISPKDSIESFFSPKRDSRISRENV